MMYDDYKRLFKQAEAVRENILGDDIDQQLTIGDMLNTINKLKVKLSEKEKEVENLYIYKEKFFKLKELI